MGRGRETVTVDLTYSFGTRIPKRLVDVAAWADHLLAKVPPEYRGQVTIDIASVSYRRAETAGEWNDRLEREEGEAADLERREQASYERLEKRFDADPGASDTGSAGAGDWWADLQRDLMREDRAIHERLKQKYG
jgi:hypothetical protein